MSRVFRFNSRYKKEYQSDYTYTIGQLGLPKGTQLVGDGTID